MKAMSLGGPAVQLKLWLVPENSYSAHLMLARAASSRDGAVKGSHFTAYVYLCVVLA